MRNCGFIAVSYKSFIWLKSGLTNSQNDKRKAENQIWSGPRGAIASRHDVISHSHWQVHLGKNRVFLNFHTCWPPENFHSSYHLTLGSWNMEIFCRFYCETMRSMDWWFMGAARTLGDTLVVGYALRFTTWCNIWLCFCLQDEKRGFSGIQTEGWHLQKKTCPRIQT